MGDYVFQARDRNVTYPDNFDFSAALTSLTGVIVNKDEHEIPVALFYPQSDIRGILAVSPGTSQIIEDQKPIIDFATTNGFAVLTWEHYGSGLATCLTDEPHAIFAKDYEEHGQDMLHCIDFAKRSLPDTPIHLLGNSLGANISLHALRINPRAVDGKVILGVPMLHAPEMNDLIWYYRVKELGAKAGSALTTIGLGGRLKWEKRASRFFIRDAEKQEKANEWEAREFEDIVPTEFSTRVKRTIATAGTIDENPLDKDSNALRKQNPHINRFHLTKSWIYHSMQACRRLRTDRGFIDCLKDTDITFLRAGNDESVCAETIEKFATRLASINPRVALLDYADAPHAMLFHTEKLRQEVLHSILSIANDDMCFEPTHKANYSDALETERGTINNVDLYSSPIPTSVKKIWNGVAFIGNSLKAPAEEQDKGPEIPDPVVIEATSQDEFTTISR